MNKFLLLTLSIMALGFAAPAMAEDHAMGHETAVESSVEGEIVVDETVVVEPCFDEYGAEIECPVVEEIVIEESAPAVEEEMTEEMPASE